MASSVYFSVDDSVPDSLPEAATCIGSMRDAAQFAAAGAGVAIFNLDVAGRFDSPLYRHVHGGKVFFTNRIAAFLYLKAARTFLVAAGGARARPLELRTHASLEELEIAIYRAALAHGSHKLLEQMDGRAKAVARAKMQRLSLLYGVVSSGVRSRTLDGQRHAAVLKVIAAKLDEIRGWTR